MDVPIALSSRKALNFPDSRDLKIAFVNALSGAGQSVSARDMHCGCAKLSM